MSLQVGAPAFACVGFLLYGVVMWVWGQRRHSLALRWLSVVQFAFALCAGFAVVRQLAFPHSFALWSDLALAALSLAVGAGLVGVVYSIREARQGSGLQR